HDLRVLREQAGEHSTQGIEGPAHVCFEHELELGRFLAERATEVEKGGFRVRSRSCLCWRAPRRPAACCAVWTPPTTSAMSPAAGNAFRPMTETGVDGPASRTLRPRSSVSTRTLPQVLPAMSTSPMRSVPSLTSTVAMGPRLLSSAA